MLARKTWLRTLSFMRKIRMNPGCRLPSNVHQNHRSGNRWGKLTKSCRQLSIQSHVCVDIGARNPLWKIYKNIQKTPIMKAYRGPYSLNINFFLIILTVSNTIRRNLYTYKLSSQAAWQWYSLLNFLSSPNTSSYMQIKQLPAVRERQIKDSIRKLWVVVTE